MAFAPPATRRRLSPRCSHLRTLHSLLLSSPIATHANVLLHDGTKKSHAPLHRRNTAFNARAYNTERPIAQSHAQPPSHTPHNAAKKRTPSHRTHKKSLAKHTPTHAGTLVIIIILAFAATRPKIPSHSPDTTPHLLAVPLATRHKHKDTTHKTRVRTRTALHRHTSHRHTTHEAYR